MSLKSFLASIFPFLFSAMQKAWLNLTAAQQAAVINSGTIGQYLKNNLTLLGDDLVALIAKATTLDPALITSTLIALAGKFGFTGTTLNDAVSFLQAKLQDASSNEEWNGILTILLNAGGTLLSGGSLNWSSIAIGIGEWAYHEFIAPKKLLTAA